MFNLALKDVFAPHDKNGLIHPMIRDGGTDLEGNPCYYPVLKQHPDGLVEPMIFGEDLRAGRITYEEGWCGKPFGVMPDGHTEPLDLSAVQFTNPLLNLPQILRGLNIFPIPAEVLPTARKVGDHLLEHGIVSPPELGSDEEDGLYVSVPKGGRCRLCNHNILVKALRCVNDNGQISYEVELQVIRRTVLGQKKEYVVCVPQSDLENLADYLSDMVPSFALASETPRAAQLLAEHLRNQLDDVPRITIFKRSGWNQYEGRHIFVHADVPAFSNAKAECGQTIVAEDMPPDIAFREAIGILGIGKLSVLLPLMLTALAGPLFKLFADAGYVPRFVTYLYGLSGSLKTAVSLVFYRFFAGQRHSTFRDTGAAIDVVVGEHRDQMLLVDDFQPAVVATDGANMRKVLEHLIRRYGDGIAKKRSNSRATAAYGRAPRGSCLVTGESMSGSYSSLLRCLLVPISRGDIDGQLLRRYQERPGLWTTNYIYFLPWIGANWDRLMEKIRTEFTSLRSYFSSVTSEPRLADTGAVLMLVSEIFLVYGVDCGALNGDCIQHTLEEWRAVIEALLDTTTDAAQDLDVVELTRDSITGAVADESLKIAPDINSFVGKLDGFFHKDLLWVKPRSMERVLQQYCSDNQLSSVRGTKAVLPELYKRGIITRDEESGKNSFLKRSPQIPALETRLRMIAFYREELFKET